MPKLSGYAPFVYLGIGILLYRTLTTHIRTLKGLEQRKNRFESSESRWQMYAKRRMLDDDDDYSDDEDEDGVVEMMDKAAEEAHRGEGESKRAKEPEDGIPLEILATLAHSPAYDIREAATKILATRFASSTSHLTSLCSTYSSAPSTSSAFTSTAEVLNLLQRYQLMQGAPPRDQEGERQSIWFGERGRRGIVVEYDTGRAEVEAVAVEEGMVGEETWPVDEVLAVLAGTGVEEPVEIQVPLGDLTWSERVEHVRAAAARGEALEPE